MDVESPGGAPGPSTSTAAAPRKRSSHPSDTDSEDTVIYSATSDETSDDSDFVPVVKNKAKRRLVRTSPSTTRAGHAVGRQWPPPKSTRTTRILHADGVVTELWLDDMYLNNSQPLPVNSSPFYLLPKQCFATSTDQARFAARFIEFAVLFKKKIDSGTLTPDVQGRGGTRQPLCMQTYKHFFPAYRRPGPTKDDLLLDTASQHQDHVIVVCRDQFFKLRIPLDQGPLDVEALTRQLLSIKQQAKDPSERQPSVGAFTTEQRRTWAGIYVKLARSNVNQSSLQSLETCLFVVCLDRPLSSLRRHYASLRRESVTLDLGTQAAHLLHGGSVADGNAANRWYDKFMQIVVSRDGINGIICEHSASEGITVLRFSEEFLQHMQQYQQQQQTPPPASPSIRTSSLCAQYPVSRLSWDLGEDVLKALQDAIKAINTLAEDVDLYILHFPNYGKNFIKEQRISPDVYIQLALQLTYYKVHRKLVSTYESASLRKFYLGRVDNIRAATAQALAWVQAMCDAVPATEEDKIQLFLEAVAKGTEILTYTVNGEGPDNHLLGLREMARLHETPAPIFNDKSYADFLHFRLSTSQLATDKGILVGYGAVVPDGYGCAYNIGADQVSYCVSSFFSSPETSSDFFALSLEGSLLQMRELCLKRATQLNMAPPPARS
ncbi:choline O-acetyltransferase-like isoform X2 [Dermacentor albipictus]|uniref:choline O-acetyltransferase-like isoform X2 n=1 Tax=Dermacentor albipictus TaxID=60249 RepID=UPI0038FC724F